MFKWDPDIPPQNGKMVAYSPRRECGAPVAYAWYRPSEAAVAHYSCASHQKQGSKHWKNLFVYKRLSPESRDVIEVAAKGPRLVRQRVERVRRSNVPEDEVE